MYRRKIDMYYCFDGEKDVEFNLIEETLAHCRNHSFDYKVKNFKHWTDLYNKALEDFDAEYDDKIADTLETLCKQFWKEKEKCDSATQE